MTVTSIASLHMLLRLNIKASIPLVPAVIPRYSMMMLGLMDWVSSRKVTQKVPTVSNRHASAASRILRLSLKIHQQKWTRNGKTLLAASRKTSLLRLLASRIFGWTHAQLGTGRYHPVLSIWIHKPHQPRNLQGLPGLRHGIALIGIPSI